MARDQSRSRSQVLGTVALLMALVPAATAHAGQPVGPRDAMPVTGELRVDQQGYLRHETKTARLMTSAPVSRTTYAVRDSAGRAVLQGVVPAHAVGSWNDGFPDVYRIDLTQVRTPGRYRLTTGGGVRTVSPWFQVAGPRQLFGQLLDDGIAFDQNQRDGADVLPGPLHRQPSHLDDASADVYAWPHMERGSDLITDAGLTPTGAAPVDAEGGWFDAGDYLKFVHSTAYNDVLLYTGARLLGAGAPASMLAEARYGAQWLEQMWDEQTGVLAFQVGIGSGNRAGTFIGDHDGWRLPQADDDDTAPGHQFVAHRPVFVANAPGRPISPNLVGRVSAALALAAQADATTDPARGLDELQRAEALYADAATQDPPHPLVTALPHAFYPESSWHDDMALGGAELALAAQALGQPGDGYVGDSAHWLAKYLHDRATGRDVDTLNLYDTGALAELSLGTAMRSVPHGRLAVTHRELVRSLGAQVRIGVAQAGRDPFGAPVDQTQFDADSHSYGLISTVAIYDLLTGTQRFQPFASGVRTWLLGGDAWGVTSMVGVGDEFPLCMQHQVANLSGTTDGSPPVDVGAVVNGPNGSANFEGGLGGFQDGMVPCTTDDRHLTSYDGPLVDGQGAQYVDDVRSWQTDEPALDMTGSAILAAATELAAGAR